MQPSTDVLRARCPTRSISLSLPLATIEELDQLDQLARDSHVSRQELLRQLINAALLSDSPHWPAGSDPIERLADRAYRVPRARLYAPGHVMTPHHSDRVIVSDDLLPALVGHTGAQYESPPQDEHAARALVALLLGFPGLPGGHGPWCSAMPGGHRTVNLEAVQRP